MALPPTMKGAWVDKFNEPYVLRTDIPTPTITDPHNMIVEIKAAGFCHTELMAQAGMFGGPPGFVPGHEPCGVVVAVGALVTKFCPGDRVGCGLFRNPCRECRECKRGKTQYCAKAKLGGLTVNGGMAQYYEADADWAVKLPDGMSFDAAAPLMCAGSTIYNSILRSRQPKGSILAIVGLGGLGHLGVQFAKALGYRCVAVDTRQAPIDLVNSLPDKFKPDLILNPLEDEPSIALEKIANQFPKATGVDAALVATDSVPAFAWSKAITAKHGTLVFIGQPQDDVPFHYTDFVTMDLTVVAGCLGDPATVQEMVDLVHKVGIEVHTKTFKLEEMDKLIEEYHNPEVKGKLVVTLN